MSLRGFLRYQFIGENFNRADMLIRHYSIKRYLEDETYDFELYEKMQRSRRQPANTYVAFKKLIHSFERSGFDEKYPIKCSLSYALLDGSHRLALAYFNKHKMIPIQVCRTNRRPKYSISWFENKKKFSIGEMGVIRQEYLFR